MASTISPNMNLVIPTVGSQPGPQYATNVNSSLTIIDGHDHSTGNGVQITPSGININAILSMNNQILSNIQALTLFAQVTPPGDLSIYASGDDLYYVDGSGNNVRITQSGSVAGASGTITGLPSGTASASFAAGTFTFQAATATGANIDGASYILRNNTASSFGLTLSPPLAMGANYTLTLPAVPAQTNVMTIDNSGNMGSITYDAVGQAMTVTGANAILTTSTNADMGGKFIRESGKNLVVSNTNATNSLAIIRGSIDVNGNPLTGEGYASARGATGQYVINYTGGSFLDVPAIVCSAIDVSGAIVAIPQSTSVAGTSVFTFSTGGPINTGFSFIIIGQRG